MGSKHAHPNSNKGRRSLSIFIILGLCCFFYLLGVWQNSGSGKGDRLAMAVTEQTENCNIFPSALDFEPHHTFVSKIDTSEPKTKPYKFCDAKYRDYTPCQEQDRAMTFPRENMIYRERHCPPDNEKLHCLIPAPNGYTTPFPWPKSRDYVYYANVPYKHLTVEKAVQNWVQYQGNVFKFPGGGTMFPKGADAYINELASVIPMANGSIRTALDTGCGVASFGAYLLKKNVIAMSFAPKDNHEAQVQFALERGVPAVIGVLGSIRLPYPSRAFDMAHCSRCLIPWAENDGMYLKEVDRVLRPGGYWVLSGPPINWKTYYKVWKRSKEDVKAEQARIEEIANLLCWEKKYEKGDIAIWRKKINANSCKARSTNTCKSKVNDGVWYKKLEGCIAPLPEVQSSDEVAGGELKKFPDRLFAVPPRISNGLVPGITAGEYQEDNKVWRKHVNGYKRIVSLLGSTRYRNIMDMNAGLGGFAAALESPKLWVMNVVPTVAKDTLGVVYERGLIGIYHDWCEGFSTYPRTYDLIHASGVFTLYQDKCEFEDILLEMDRILRPEGTVIFRDGVEALNKVRQVGLGMRWEMKLTDHEDGPLVPEKILVAVKPYDSAADENSTTKSSSE
ncbi:unnamed protein product [Cuscuta campestris]|uniref:Methyltransferase n=1 Tax=Cuscuta campestris TaxID=132261 RepID=A0A484MA76_9ASTE|nr:unnamed protein product [Cuscuta campestris]